MVSCMNIYPTTRSYRTHSGVFDLVYRSTVTALLSVTQEWLSALQCGQELCAVFFDYQKAFDSVPHLPLLEKLESLDFNGHIRCWVTDYLTI